MHAVSDIGALVEWLQERIAFGQDSTENLAVLHNQNHMVHEFGLSAWVIDAIKATSHISKCYFMCWNDCLHGGGGSN